MSRLKYEVEQEILLKAAFAMQKGPSIIIMRQKFYENQRRRGLKLPLYEDLYEKVSKYR